MSGAVERWGRRARLVVPVLVVGLPLITLVALCVGMAGPIDARAALRGLLALAGFGEPLPGALQTVLELRLWRALTTLAVGGALALSGAYLQGLFRNSLAEPALLGLTGGATLGAVVGILLLAGWGPAALLGGDLGGRTLVIPLFGFAGAVAAVLLVGLLAAPDGRLSVPTLLLAGVAVNSCLGGLLALVSSLTLQDYELNRAIAAWTFGTLEDRSAWHALTAWGGLAAALAVAPFVAWELDLFAGGEEDAASLGVATGRVRALVVAAAALSAAAAVAVAGQIAFVGLVVPHMLRLLVGPGHGRLLPLSALGGAVFLLGVDTLQRFLVGDGRLQPGVTMALVGGALFLALLLVERRRLLTW